MDVKLVLGILLKAAIMTLWEVLKSCLAALVEDVAVELASFSMVCASSLSQRETPGKRRVAGAQRSLCYLR